MIALALASTAFGQDCSGGGGLDRLTTDLDAAERGYGSLDATGFADHLDEASLDLPCVGKAVPPPLAARYHLLVGLRAYVDGKEADADASFAAARTADPGYAIADSLVPAGHEIRSLYTAADPGPFAPIPAPMTGQVLLDGRPTTSRPTARPGIVQVVLPDGSVEVTRYLHPSDPLPDYAQVPSLAGALGGPAPLPHPHAGPRHPAWLVAGGVGFGGSIALYALASRSAAAFVGPLPADLGRSGLESMRTRTNALVVGSAVAGAVGAVGLTGFVVRW